MDRDEQLRRLEHKKRKEARENLAHEIEQMKRLTDEMEKERQI